ncbi:hypothetical protein [Nonomuraea africana]|uniref:hypothetical protein n=1 Tax=Nonomuraea africana TaxID=46171 RepID=UPI0033EE0A7F
MNILKSALAASAIVASALAVPMTMPAQASTISTAAVHAPQASCRADIPNNNNNNNNNGGGGNNNNNNNNNNGGRGNNNNNNNNNN